MNHSLTDLLKVWPQYLLPQHTLSRTVYFLARWKLPVWKNVLIQLFIRIFNVNMAEAEVNEPEKYSSFNEFFTRRLKADARPIDNNTSTIISPVDGYLSEFGDITGNSLIQAKGMAYTLDRLLSGNTGLVKQFQNGRFATLYLSPKNYHRIHMPCKGQLQQMIYIPGRLFAVNSHTTRVVDHLFGRNERAVIIYATDLGPLAMIMVGAIFVGNMETVWSGEINNPYPKQIQTDHYASLARPIALDKGEEMGRFNMGSTVILLFEKNALEWDATLVRGQEIRMGETLGNRIRESGGSIQ